jgi:hypothetical protein
LKPKLSFRQSASGQPFHGYAREVLLRGLAVSFFVVPLGASETVLMIHPLRGKGRSSALAAWLKESPHIRIKPRV